MTDCCTQKIKIGYNFPYNNGGEICGINNPGIETFRGNPISSLAKETIQNALDAHLSNNLNPVEVKFNLSYINKSSFPYIDQFLNILNSCKDYSNNNKALHTIETAINILNSDTIPVLEIADFNTIGLKDSQKTKGGNFNNLVKSSGVSDKPDDAGGSFGIGKNAPFACSLLRFVIYSTLDEDNIKALQGVAKWSTHLHNGRETQGTGYFGLTKELDNGDIQNRPFINSDLLEADIDEYFIRKNTGTSLFVMGFLGDENWKTAVIKSTVESYFMAIYENKLSVVVEDIKINKDTLDSIINDYFNIKDDLLTISYYRSLLYRDPIIHNFMDECDIKLYLLPEKELPKKIAYVRSNGMKIIDKGNFKVPQQFAGVLKFEGKNINKFIRSLENPSHDRIQANRYHNPKEAESILRDLSKWITSKIKEFSNFNYEEKLNMDWLSNTLPGKSNDNSEIKIKESIHKSISQVMLNKIEKPKRGKKVPPDTGITSPDNEDSNDLPKTPVNLKPSDSGVNPTDRKNRDSKIKPIDIKASRIFSPVNTSSYTAVIQSNNSCNTYLELRIVGEDGKSEIATITSIKDEKGKNIEIKNNNVFGPIKFKKNETKKLEFNILNPNRCALEVLSFENDI